MSRVLILAVFLSFILLAGAETRASKTNYVRSLLEIFSKTDNYTVPLSICYAYPFQLYPIPPVPVQTYNLQNETGVDLCNNLTDSDFLTNEPNTILLLWASSKCSIDHNVEHMQNGNASGYIIISNSSSLFQINETYGWDVVGVIGSSDSKEIVKILSDEDLKVRFYGLNKFDGSLLVLWAAAIVCVAVGSYTGPRLLFNRKGSTSTEHEALEQASHADRDDANLVAITVPTILAIVVFICTTLMLLYFFFIYLVYFIIVVFAISTPRAVYLLTMQVVGSWLTPINFPVWRNYGFVEIVVGLLSISLGIIWCVFRNEFWSWPLQDFLGICFCIHLIQFLQLPNMKVITMLLILLFIYDIFFVFITPYLTKNGESVMLAVATGGGSTETIPMLLKCPHFQSAAIRSCSTSGFSMLGYGDVIVPGFLVSFAHCFDLRVGGKYPVYLITSVFAYAIGLAGAFVALVISSTGQPALLYVVPVVLANIFLVGLCRKEVGGLWSGKPDLRVELEAHA